MEKCICENRLLVAVIVVMLGIAVAWFLFADHRPDRDNIGAGFQQVDDQLGRVRDGIDRSEATVERLERSIDDSTRTAIAVGDGIDRAYESASRIEDASEEATRAVGTAIEGNNVAQTAVERSLDRLRESQSILAKYQTGSRKDD